MKIVLVSLNAKYIHTSLAIRYLAETIRDEHDAVIHDFTIHDNVLQMAREIYANDPEITGFSMYLWNRQETLKLIRIIRRILPHVKIIVGGPEVSYDSETFLLENPEVDAVVRGEGERAWRELVTHLEAGSADWGDIPNISWRNGVLLEQNATQIPEVSMDSIPYPYAGTRDFDPHRIYYYESSRGCPFNCSFCMSSLDKAVRCLSWDRVRKDLDHILHSGMRLVKFVDRTFNYDRVRAKRIWGYLLENYQPDMTFHFEIAADLLDQDTIEFLSRVPGGYFQMEIGVQSTNPDVLKAVLRNSCINKIFQNVKQLLKEDNIHLHLDLIAGLPFEDWDSLQVSFDCIYSLQAHMLQFGFLKMLPGSLIREQALPWRYQYMPDPPYQVLSNQWLTYDELSRIADVEVLLNIYYNSGRFAHSLRFLVNLSKSPFSMFLRLADFWQPVLLSKKGVSVGEQFSLLACFVGQEYKQSYGEFLEVLRFDYYLFEKPGQLPDWCEEPELIPGSIKQELLLKIIPQEFPQLLAEPTSLLRRQTEIAIFNYDSETGAARPSFYLFYYPKRKEGSRTHSKRIEDKIVNDVIKS